VRVALVALALTLASTASAQIISGGVRYDPEGFTATVNLELPAFDLLGFRAGPVVAVTGLSRSYGLGLEASAGLSFAFVHAGAGWLLDVGWAALVRDGFPLRHGPRVIVTFSKRF
jgi:hypothetical protein